MSPTPAHAHPVPVFPSGSIAFQPAASRALRWKRPFDVVLAAVLLLCAFPFLVAIALLIRLEGGGPLFFRQERVGRLGAHFRIWKFRTMKLHADDAPHREAAQAWFSAVPCFGSSFKDDRDPRVTRVGRLLRKTDLDELPQLWNVLSGEMSLVGPRPAIPYELDLYQPEYFVRELVRPGMTGLWQVTPHRECVSAAGMMRLDAVYVQGASPGLDLKILGLTALFMLRRLCRRSHRGVPA
jgi:lipopolysaccharide/colanic/teichoic acid biosynthesis glycosyltransferase